MEKLLTCEEFMAKINKRDLEKRKAENKPNEADKHIFENNLRIQKAKRRYDNRRVNCGRC